MKHLLKKIALQNVKVLAHAKVGSSAFNVFSKEGRVHASYNGCNIFDLEKNDIVKVAAVWSDIIKKMASSSKAAVKVYVDDQTPEMTPCSDRIKADLPTTVIKSIPRNTAPIEETMQDEFSVDDIGGYDHLIKSLLRLKGIIGDLSTVLNVCRNDAITLSEGKLVGTMWGAKPMKDVMCGIHSGIVGDGSWEKVEFYWTMLSKSIDRLILKFQTDLAKVCQEEKRVINMVLIPSVLDSYNQIKATAARALMSLSSLVYSDAVFRKHTSYPARWFLNGGMLDDVCGDYNKLITFLMQTPEIEKDVVYPLEFMRMKFINECRTK